MARGDTGKWVARAGATGGGRTYRGQMPVKWYASLVLICVLGVALIVYSRYERQHPAPAVQPAIGAHWYQALSFDVCGSPPTPVNLPANPNASTPPVPGIRTNGDGVIQVSPTAASDAGNNATLARFVAHYPKLTLTATTLKLPGGTAYKNGQACAAGTKDAGQKASLQIKVWPYFTPPGSNHPVVFHDPAAVKLADGQLITVAFVPQGSSIPKPSSIVAMLNDRAGSAGATSTTLPTLSPTTVAGATTTTVATTAPPTSAATTTTSAHATTTTKPAASPTTTRGK